MNRLIAASLLLLAATSVQGADEPQFSEAELEASGEAFSLFNDCRPIFMQASVSENNFGLAEERIRTLAESHLRVAGLMFPSPVFHPHPDPVQAAAGVELIYVDPEEMRRRSRFLLYVSVDTFEDGRAYRTSVTVSKGVTDSISGIYGLAQTWSVGSYGLNGTAGGILQTISEQIDEFINEYLRVNKSACD